MQSQSLRQKTAISSQQSLSVVKTLLTISFGCIAYLRNLLPEENFGEAHLTSEDRGSMACISQEAPGDRNSRHSSGITVKTVARGFSTEADKLLNYLEHGIFDAIERRYLKSFIFAIYLDDNNPNNIVESYTYNLTYRTVPGTTTTVPILSLDDQLNRLSLDTSSKAKNSDAVAQAMLKGKAPTLGDVKQSVKTLVKSLILTTQALEPLPKRRFATFKILYTEDTPADYEPPYFRPGDPEKHKFVFTTHDRSEVPEKYSVGTVVTPHHGIDVEVQSIARFLPNDEKDDSRYIGIEKATKKKFGTSQGVLDAESRAKQLEAQRKDAENRKFAWNAQDSRWADEDAEGEADPDLVNDSGVVLDVPKGLNEANSNNTPSHHQAQDAMDLATDARFFGKPDVVPSRLGQLRAMRPIAEDMEPTQQLDAAQAKSTSCEGATITSTAGDIEVQHTLFSIDTQAVKAALDESAMDWSGTGEMLDLGTQVADLSDHDPIQPYSQDNEKSKRKMPPSRVSDVKSSSESVSCACEHEDDDDVVFCELCKKWLHIRCMGYYSADDPRLPAKYVCIPCRLQGDVNFQFIKDEYPNILAAYMDLALFRRAIKFAEVHNPDSLKAFRKLTKCDASLAESLWNRLEREGFIVLEVMQVDKLGLLETRSRNSRTTKKVKGAKQIQKYVFNAASKKTALYREYFSPDSEAEKNMIGLGRKSRHMKKAKSEKEKAKGLDSPPAMPLMQPRQAADENPTSPGNAADAQMQIESQTQDETQYIPTSVGAADLKRRPGMGSQESTRSSKKVRISVVEENVDIEE